jgi:phosphate transport system permease protein
MRKVDRLRRTTSATMTTLTALCTVTAVGILLIILGYIAMQGIGSLNLRFLVESPKPVGEGGGIGNAILGTLVLLGLSVSISPSLARGVSEAWFDFCRTR